ncbi:MAG: 3-deoxy-manno-octulosonate cytidylyltransferase [Alphaproteobacteria bacterium HGW-Alphaproteobacteria-14]|nr:MAG: 3-deoxy-manno-octulosonate cytidylyltransferase [Alphaproteobacteria bacterium HGW-Alphaproteobacteria-14]
MNPPACDWQADRCSPDLIVIPARYGSTRLAGKPLLTLAGRTLLSRVVANAARAADLAQACALVVATDDERIADHAGALGVRAILTDPALTSGSARAHAAALVLAAEGLASERIINLQGDAPFIPPTIIAALITALRESRAAVATPVYRLDWERLDRLRAHKQAAPFSGTTCVRDANGRALWFSKTIIPAIRGEASLRCQPFSPVWQHLGLYGYSRAALEWFVATPEGEYETLEGLEQLRFLEHGWPIATVPVAPPEHLVSGIDTPEDLVVAEAAIARLGDPFPA